MSLINFEGKSLEKLIETVSAGIGVKYTAKISQQTISEGQRPEQIEEVIMQGLTMQGDNEIFDKIKQRLIHQEVNRQINLDNIIEKSTNYLNENVSDNPVDEDWRTKYFAKAQDINSNEMQDIWARILANEVSSPGAISLRTLDIVSNLNKKEAETFQRAASLSFSGGRILKIKDENSFDDFGLTFNDLLLLKAANLIHESNSLNVTYNHVDFINGTILQFGNRALRVFKENTPKYVFNQVAFTPAGKELLHILKFDSNYKYLSKFIEEKTKEGYQLIDMNTTTQ